MNHDVPSGKKGFYNPLFRQQGFMITEVLMTTLIIIITMVAIIPIFMVGVKSGKVSKYRTVEMTMAQKEIERFNQDNFLTVFNYLQTEISKPTSPITLNEFTGKDPDPSKHKNFIEAQTVFVNSTNGETTPNIKPGFNTVFIKKEYTFLKGEETQIDDVIKLAVQVQISGQSNKPVVLTALLSRDKRK